MVPDRFAMISALSFFLAGHLASAAAQASDYNQVGNLNVHVNYINDRAAESHFRVRLMTGSGSTPVAESFTDERGVVQFLRVFVGEYHIIVTGDGIREADSGAFEVDRRKATQDIFITVHPANEAATIQRSSGTSSFAVPDLNIPSKAHKEFEKGVRAMTDQDWNKAVQRLNRAIELYPQYAMAYNNLGLVYGRINDPAHEREALEKAIALDDHLVPALVNLAKLSLRDGNALRAESLLESAVRSEPTGVETLTLLAQAQLLDRRFDAAVGTAQKVHAMPHQNFAVVHYIAARAYERENRVPDAILELQIFLKEEPTGPRADQVRAELTRLQHSPR